MRHAKSLRDGTVPIDFDRPLNERGIKDAPEMGKRILAQQLLPEIIISSMAMRALTTANLVADTISYPLQKIESNIEIYHADISDMMHVIRSIEDKFHSAMLIGHNPTFTGLVGFLTYQPIAHMPTASIVCIEFNITSWHQVSEGNGKIIWFDFPKNLASD